MTRPLEARIARAPLTVGDPLVVELRGVLPRAATLIDRTARVRDTLPDGVRLVSTDSVRVHDGIVVAYARVAFFRPDSQVVPSFAIAYQTSAGTDTLVSAALPVFVRAVLPTGNATLRDVRDVEAPIPVVGPTLVLAALAIAWLIRRAWRRQRRAAPVAPVSTALEPNAYELALARLRTIDPALPVERRYTLTVDIVREYIARSRAVPATERTTPEILAALGMNGAMSSFLREADLVKFAGLRPDARAASAYTTRAREVLDALR